jgi:hypothetical protein
MSINNAYDTWNWIKNVELKYGIDMRPIPDIYCKALIVRIERLLPVLQLNTTPQYKTALNDKFCSKFERKLLKANMERSMLFDFIKNMIHEILLKEMVVDEE